MDRLAMEKGKKGERYLAAGREVTIDQMIDWICVRLPAHPPHTASWKERRPPHTDGGFEGW